MQLFYSKTSPYARKCRALALEKGIALELVEAAPTDDPAALHAANPLGKVPALARPDGPALIDSPVICAYLDSLSEPRFIPEDGEARWACLRFEAMADGLIDLTVGRRIEMMRPEAKRHPFWVERWERGVIRTLDQLEAERDALAAPTLGAIAAAAALGYLDLRFKELDWRARWPGLKAFADTWHGRASFLETAPPETA